MLVSTKGRYALRVMVDLAENKDKGYVPLKEIAERQGISFKYTEQIMSLLKKHNIVEGRHGKGGGYKLTKKPEEYTVAEILKATETKLSIVSCLQSEKNSCPQKNDCRTLPMWTELNDIIDKYFSVKTIADLTKC